MSDSEVWTVGRLLEWTTDYLHQQAATSPRLDAEVLLATARQCERIELYTAFEEEPDDATLATFRGLVRRRANGEPVAYLVGHREFFSLTFHVSPDVLIPRPETEFVVVALLDEAKHLSGTQQPIQIADVGTGSGVIAICAAKNIANCLVTAIDISPAALAIAETNADRHGVKDKIAFVESNLFNGVPKQPVDIVVSNPPYVSIAEMSELPREVAGYEPHIALLGGDTGMEIIARLVSDSASRLKPEGMLILEVSPMIAEAVCCLINEHPTFDSPRIIKDLAGLARVVVAHKKH